MAKSKKKIVKKVAKKKVASPKKVKKSALAKKAKKIAKASKKASPASKVKVSPARKMAAKLAAPQASSLKLNWKNFVTPLDDRLIVHLERGEKRTPGGLIIPDSVSSSAGHLKGEVVAVGRGHRDTKGKIRPMDVQVGNRVLFTEYAGSKVNWNGQEVIILRENEVLGIVD